MGALIEWEPWAASQKVLSACAQRFLEYDFLMLQRVPSRVGPVFIREPIPVVPAGDGDLLVIGRDGAGQPIAIEREMERVLVGTGRVLVNSSLKQFLLGLHVLTSWYPYGSRRDRSRLLAGAVEIREALADIDPPAVEGEDTFWSRLLDPEVFADSFCDERLQCDWGIDCLGEPIIDVRLNTSGRVVNGDYRGWTVRVEPDRPLPPCGYYVLITKTTRDTTIGCPTGRVWTGISLNRDGMWIGTHESTTAIMSLSHQEDPRTGGLARIGVMTPKGPGRRRVLRRHARHSHSAPILPAVPRRSPSLSPRFW